MIVDNFISYLIYAVAVVEELQRKGVGKSMMLDAEKWAKVEGFDCVYLLCSTDVEVFYKKCGYSEVNSGVYAEFLKKEI